MFLSLYFLIVFVVCAFCQDECVQNPTVVNQYFGHDSTPNILCKTECPPGLPGKSGPKGEAGLKVILIRMHDIIVGYALCQKKVVHLIDADLLVRYESFIHQPPFVPE